MWSRPTTSRRREFLDRLEPRRRASLLAARQPTSHVAMLARARGVPMVVATAATDCLRRAAALVDGDAGRRRPRSRSARRAPTSAARRARRRRSDAAAQPHLVRRPAVMADGTSRRGAAQRRRPGRARRARSGHLRRHRPGAHRVPVPRRRPAGRGCASSPSTAASPTGPPARPVTIRTLDAGGDKPIPGLTLDDESNPFLGLRGIRLSLAHPDVFKVQLRALARAARRTATSR